MMDLQLSGKIALVTGASKGIGWACAEALAHEGAKVVLVSRSRTNLDAALARWPKSAAVPHVIAADLTRAEDAVRGRMVQRGRGAIVNIIGMGGKVASPVHLPGGAANAALMLATVGLATAFGPKGIRINAINPGATLTGRVQEGLRAESKMTGLPEAEVLARNQSKIPLGRLGTPEEVAQLAVFLASDRASYLTGAIVPMDGGAASVI